MDFGVLICNHKGYKMLHFASRANYCYPVPLKIVFLP